MSSPESTPPLLEMRGISKTFPGVRALDNVRLSVHPGEVHALMGENGAGKSTLMKILSGAYQADPGGQILIDGQTGRDRRPARGQGARHRGHLPGTEPRAEPVGRREHLRSAASCAAPGPRRPAPRWSAAARDVLKRLGADVQARRRSSATCRSPSASSSRSRAPCTPTPASSSWTSRPRRSRRARPTACSTLIRQLRERRPRDHLHQPPDGGDLRAGRPRHGAARRRLCRHADARRAVAPTAS